MDDEQTIFADALAIASPRRRREFLDQACGGDAELQERVEVLLAAHERAGSFLESPPVDPRTPESDGAATAAAAGAPVERPGAVVGSYKLLEQIGEGGMGVVFMAEQTRPVRRRVALKIIKPGMDTKQVIARFEAERQALAMMDHPNIAKVLEAGATENGRPYFVMELVRGVPFTEYCDQQKLAPRQRLELFIQVCQAVQHAHQKGIIHRDLKPSNVLVTLSDDGKPVPKIIDFGIAKATAGQPLTEQTLFTELHQLVGTPLYMSPEQAEMSALQDVDTRSDVYSLGVLLYELLTGTTPFDKQRLGKAAYDEVRRIIREEEPPRPSTRISTLGDALANVSAHRHTDPRKLSTILRGELDWVVMRALEKDRGRRYETAIGFAQDVERYLADQPVEACPPSRVYRVRKFARRNKAAITTTSLIAAVLMAATAASTWAAVRARRAEWQAARERDHVTAEKRRADEQAEITRAINEFLNKDVLGQADIENQLGRKGFSPDPDVKVRDVLDRAAAGIADRFADQPLVEAAIRHTLGDAYAALEEYKTGEAHLQAALRVRRRLLGDAHADTRETLEKLCALYASAEQYAKAEALLVPALESHRQTLGGRHRDTLRTMAHLGGVYLEQRKELEAEQLLSEALNGQRAVLGETDVRTQSTSALLARLYLRRHNYAKAEKILRDLLDIERKMHREHLQVSIVARDLLGDYCSYVGRHKEGETLLLAALEDTRRLNGRKAQIYILHHLAIAYCTAGNAAEAERRAHESLESARKEFGEHNRVATSSLACLGFVYVKDRQFEKAEPILLQFVEEVRSGYGDDDDDGNVAIAFGDLAEMYAQKGDFGKQVIYLEQAWEAARKRYGEHHVQLTHVLHDLGVAYLDHDQLEKSETVLLRYFDEVRNGYRSDDEDVAGALDSLAEVYLRKGQCDKAMSYAKQALEISHKALGAEDPDALARKLRLGRVYGGQGDLSKAEPLVEEALAGLRKAAGDRDRRTIQAMEQVAAVYEARRRFADAERLRREVLSVREDATGPESLQVAASVLRLAEVVRAEGRNDEAEALFRRALAIHRTTSGPESTQVRWILPDLAGALRMQGRYEEANKLEFEALAIQKKLTGPESPAVGRAMRRLAYLLSGQRRYADAETLVRHALAIQRNATGPDSAEFGDALRDLAGEMMRQRRLAEAEEVYRQAIRIQEKATGNDSVVVGQLLTGLASAVMGQSHLEDARQIAERAVNILRKGNDIGALAEAITTLGKISTRLGDMVETEKLLCEALALRRKSLPPDGAKIAPLLSGLAAISLSKGDYATSEKLSVEALGIFQKTAAPDDQAAAGCKSGLAEAVALQKRYAEAEALMLAADSVLSLQTGSAYWRDNLDRLARLYVEWGKPDRAAPWLKQLWEAELKAKTAAITASKGSNPKLPELLTDRVLLYTRLGRSKEADADVARVVELGNANVPTAVRARANLYERLGRFEDALADVNRMLDAAPSDLAALEEAAAIQLYLGRVPEYLAARKVLLGRLDETKTDHPLKTCLLLALSPEEATATVAIADRNLRNASNPYYDSGKGLVEYRAGNYDEAKKWLARGSEQLTQLLATTRFTSRESKILDEIRTTNDYLTALCEHQLGHEEQARQIMAQAEARLHAHTPAVATGPQKVGSLDWLMVHVIAREARATFAGQGPTTTPPATRPATRPTTMATAP